MSTYTSDTTKHLAALLDLFAGCGATTVRLGRRAADHYGPTLLTRLCKPRGLTWEIE